MYRLPDGSRQLTVNVPGSETAPGPGRFADPSTAPLPVPGMQKVAARVAVVGAPIVRGPAATPFSLIVRQSLLPKQPCAVTVWPGQNWPVAFVEVRVLVSDGERLTEMVPIFVAFVGMQSRVRPAGFVLVQGRVLRAPPTHVPTPGAPGLPVAEHFGHRARPVR